MSAVNHAPVRFSISIPPSETGGEGRATGRCAQSTHSFTSKGVALSHGRAPSVSMIPSAPLAGLKLGRVAPSACAPVHSVSADLVHHWHAFLYSSSLPMPVHV